VFINEHYSNLDITLHLSGYPLVIRLITYLVFRFPLKNFLFLSINIAQNFNKKVYYINYRTIFSLKKWQIFCPKKIVYFLHGHQLTVIIFKKIKETRPEQRRLILT